METWGHILFGVITFGVFGFFAFNLHQIWLRMHRIGRGHEEIRNDDSPNRLTFAFFNGFIQPRMFDDMVAGAMHFGIFWGFIIVNLGTLEALLSGMIPHFSFHQILGHGTMMKAYISSQDLGNFMVFLAVSFAIARRLFFAPPRLASLSNAAKKDALVVLGMIWALVGTSLLHIGANAQMHLLFTSSGISTHNAVFSTSLFYLMDKVGLMSLHDFNQLKTISSISWWSHIAVLFSFVTFLPYSKHQHLIWVWPNMFFKSQKSTGKLRKMEIDENAEAFGVGDAKGFTWKQYLDAMACVECGRCTDVCPAQATEKALDPRKMIHHLKDAMFDADQADQNPDQTPKQLIGEIVSRDELWACTTCGACMDACPLHIEHIPAIVDMRRYMSMTEGEMPEQLQSTMESLEQYSNPWGFNNESRAEWAKGLGVTTMAEKSDVDYLFWVGCAGSFDERYKSVSIAFTKIMQRAGVSFSILGAEETCNGDSARRAGNEYLAMMQIEQNIETMKGYGVSKIVTGCPHCFNTIQNEYPDYGFKAEVLHHSKLIAELMGTGKIPLPSSQTAVPTTYHDSCYLGRHNDIYEEPRKLIPIEQQIEMPRNRDKGFCCGAGGARMWMEETEGTRINVNRSAEALSTGAKVIATACPFCMTMMKDGVEAHGQGEQVAVRDVAEIVAHSLNQAE